MPATIHVAVSFPVNPPNTTPLITHQQLWAALERKVHRAQDFVPVFTDCQVLKEEVDSSGNKVITRRAMLKDGAMEHVKERYIEEICTLYVPTKVDFLAPGNYNSLVQNVIADGPGMTDQDLQLSYIFDWTYPDVEAGSAEEQQKVEEQKKTASVAIGKTLEFTRAMIEKREL